MSKIETTEIDIGPEGRLLYKNVTSATANELPYAFINVESINGMPFHIILDAKSAMQLSRALQMSIYHACLMAAVADDAMLQRATKHIERCK